MGIEDIPKDKLDAMLEADFAELERLHAAAEEHHYEDPGVDGYNSEHEDELRGLMELLAFYDEAGPRHDPEGKYLCGTCSLRDESDAVDIADRCLFVSGAISMPTGSCNLYVIGEPLGADFALKEKYNQEAAGYAERHAEQSFGCGHCEYGVEAQKPDVDGRPLWCREWGVHVQPTACCDRHNGPDMVLAPGE
jgi:hypothetical protein